MTHVHGLGLNPADGQLYVGTHDGLYQILADGRARPVGTGRQDLMGFIVAGPNEFLASGHPAPGEDSPDHLGLIESSDGGVTWTSRSLAGQADFHALRYRHDTVFGYDSTTGQLMTSPDKVNWQTLVTMRLRDFDVSPIDRQALLATTEDGLQRSTDGGHTWVATGAPGLLLLAWERADQLWAITTAAEVLRSTDGGHTWVPTGSVPGPPSALTVHDGTLYASVDETGIFASADQGATWRAVYTNP